MRKRDRILSILILSFVALSLTGCFKEWKYEEVQEWYDKKPENFAEYMQLAKQKLNEGKTERAIQIYQDAMSDTEGLYGPDDPRIATAAEEAGTLQEKLGYFGAAEDMYKRALEIRVKNEPRSNDTKRTRQKLAGVLMKLYKADEAKAVLSGSSATPPKPGDQSKKNHHVKRR